MTARDARRRRRRDGELGEEEDLERRRKPDDHYFKGIYTAKPKHFGAAWPTLRTETFVEMVFGSIKDRGKATYKDILADTKLDEDIIGTCLADLLLWKESVATKGEGEARIYFEK